jgi:hypothetical protein
VIIRSEYREDSRIHSIAMRTGGKSAMDTTRRLTITVTLVAILAVICVSTVSAYDPTGQDPTSSGPEQDAGIRLDKTVGVDPMTCAATDSIEVAPYTDVVYCFTGTNTGDLSLMLHDLADSELGVLLDDFPYELAPGASVEVTGTANISTTTANSATWTAYTAGGLQASSSDTAEVIVPDPSIVVTKTVGTDPSTCAAANSIEVAPYTDVYFCYTVLNTSPYTLPLHDLEDSELGVLLDEFAFDLGPGASVNNVAAGLPVSATSAATTVNTATWTAYYAGGPFATAMASAEVIVPDPSITMTKTVGTDPDVCATNSSVEVGPYTDVTYCYTVLNTSPYSLPLHDLEDTELGMLLDEFEFELGPGASVELTTTVNIDATTVNTATWTAYYAGGPYASSTDSAEVIVRPPSIEVNKTVGTDPDVCADTDEILICADSEVYYCYEVTNTGLSTLPIHDVVDDQLGDILTNFPYTLTAGASVALTVPTTIEYSTVNEVTWLASDPGLGLTAVATDTASVDVARLDISKTKLYPAPGYDYVLIGEPAVFQVDIMNTGVTSVTNLVLTDVYSDTCMTYNSADPPPNETDPLRWTELLAPGEVLPPGGMISATLYFTPTDACTESFNTVTVTGDSDIGSGLCDLQATDTIEFEIQAPAARIGGHVFHDLNMNGLYEPWFGEPGIGGVTVTRNGGFSTTSNDVNGWYGFYIGSHELPGLFTVTEVQPPGYVSTTPDSYTVEVQDGDHIMNLNFGEVPGAASIEMEKTVGTDPMVCATTDAIDVVAGTEVYYCYTVTNTGNATLNLHDLEDSELGTILDDFSFPLTPGASVNTVAAGLTLSATIDSTTTNTATWTAFSDSIVTASAMDTATVNVVQPSIEVAKTVGTDPAVCSTSDAISVLPGTEVYYCYAVTNTGDVTLNLHDLVDSELGTILDDFSFPLAPGASVDTVAAGLTLSATIEADTVNTATWTAFNDAIVTASAMDSAAVYVQDQTIYLPLVLRND